MKKILKKLTFIYCMTTYNKDSKIRLAYLIIQNSGYNQKKNLTRIHNLPPFVLFSLFLISYSFLWVERKEERISNMVLKLMQWVNFKINFQNI